MQSTIKLFTRESLRDIRDAALTEASYYAENQVWIQAYLRLADAADHIDAMLARSEEKIVGVAG